MFTIKFFNSRKKDGFNSMVYEVPRYEIDHNDNGEVDIIMFSSLGYEHVPAAVEQITYRESGEGYSHAYVMNSSGKTIDHLKAFRN